MSLNPYRNTIFIFLKRRFLIKQTVSLKFASLKGFGDVVSKDLFSFKQVMKLSGIRIRLEPDFSGAI